jgi:uncharacterized protein
MLACLVGFNASGQKLKQKNWGREYYDFEKKFVYKVFQYSIDTRKSDGEYMQYYPNGTLSAKGQYANGLQDGSWEFFYENSSRKASGKFSNGNREGLWKYHYENGQPKQTGTIRHNIKRGIWKYYYENGRLKSEGELADGTNQGLWKYYREDGTEKAFALFRKGKGYYKEFYQTGSIKMEGLIRGDRSDSIWRYYYEQGQLKAIGQERNGLKFGPWKFFHPDGQMMSEGEYLADQEEGEWIYYYPNGQISSKGKLSAGKKQGSWNLYYDSGKFMGGGSFTDGDGKYQEFYDNGKLKIEGKISSGLYEGIWKYYYEDGPLEGECAYLLGEGEYQGYYPDGSRKITGRLKNGQKTGIWRLYDPSGSLSGLYKTYFERPDSTRSQSLALSLPLVDKQPTDTAKEVVPLVVKDATIRKKRKQVLPTQGIQFFKPKINEVRSFILSINPLAPILFQLPVGLEYYMDRRLGYELYTTFYRNPVLSNFQKRLEEEYYTTLREGISIAVRQKLYLYSRTRGITYLGQEIRYTYYGYKSSGEVLGADSITRPSFFQGHENRVEVSIIVGRRYLTSSGRRGSFTVDIFGGIGVGYRLVNLPKIEDQFKDIGRNKVAFPLRIGFMVGYLL